LKFYGDTAEADLNISMICGGGADAEEERMRRRSGCGGGADAEEERMRRRSGCRAKLFWTRSGVGKMRLRPPLISIEGKDFL